MSRTLRSGSLATSRSSSTTKSTAPSYPELLHILEDEPLAPKGNVVARSICWGGKWGSTESKALPYVVFKDNLLDTDPQFCDAPTFELQDDSPAFKLGFQRIAFEKMGLYPSEDRASWPVAHSPGSPPELLPQQF